MRSKACSAMQELSKGVEMSQATLQHRKQTLILPKQRQGMTILPNISLWAMILVQIELSSSPSRLYRAYRRAVTLLIRPLQAMCLVPIKVLITRSSQLSSFLRHLRSTATTLRWAPQHTTSMNLHSGLEERSLKRFLRIRVTAIRPPLSSLELPLKK